MKSYQKTFFIEIVSLLQHGNHRQVLNVRSKQQQKNSISHDGFYVLHEIAVAISEYIHEIHTYPDLVRVLVQKAMQHV